MRRRAAVGAERPPLRGRARAAAFAFACTLLLAGCAGTPPPAPDAAARAPQPEQASARVARPLQRFGREAIVAAHPLAAEAGARMLREGGNAIDAAIAAQWVLGLVEPQSSGLGGGGFLLHWDGREVRAYDGRETAPAAADERLLLDADGVPLAFPVAAVGGRSVGVPGLPAMLELAHRAHGRLPWAQLFEPAIALAEAGFAVSPRLHALLQGDAALRGDPDARALYYDAFGAARPVGSLLRNPEYAALLRELARSGAARFYAGRLGRFVAATVNSHPVNAGRLSFDDLNAYRALERAPLCHDWRRWRVCGMPPPSSGALFIGQMLGMLERLPADTLRWRDGRPGADFVHASADRERFVADPAFVDAPAGRWERLLDADYLAARAALIGARSQGFPASGDPAGSGAAPSAPKTSTELPATTHLSVVDAEGRAVALTSSIEAQFGARVMVNRGLGLAGGFLLNNQLTDFSFTPIDGLGRLAVNRVAPGKRPRSSMAPTLVFERGDDGALRLLLVAGSPGGPAIPQFVARTLWAVLVEGLDAQAAVALPHAVALPGVTWLESDAVDAATARALEARGHAVRRTPLTSGLHLLRRSDGGWEAGIDPRREGAAAGR